MFSINHFFYFLSSFKKQDFNALKKRQGVGELRTVKLYKDAKEALGISITGGKEHGLPILISEIYEGGPAWRGGQLYVGDSILAVNKHDLRDKKHAEAVQILSSIVCTYFDFSQINLLF
jgi:hypothetical protein